MLHASSPWLHEVLPRANSHSVKSTSESGLAQPLIGVMKSLNSDRFGLNRIFISFNRIDVKSALSVVSRDKEL